MKRLVPLVALFAAAPFAAAQGSTLPGSHPSSIESQRAQFDAAMRAEVDTLLAALSVDIAKKKEGWIADDYSELAVIVLADGTRIERRDEIKRYYARLLARAASAQLTVQEVTEIRGGYRVDAQITFQLRVIDGAPYEYAVPVKLEMHPSAQNRMLIDAQQGGDLPAIVALGGGSVRTVPLGKGDTLRVKVTSAAGIAIPNVAVRFKVASGAGSVSPDSAMTDYEGIAETYFSQGAVVAPSRVDVVAAVLPSEPVPFRIRATAVAP